MLRQEINAFVASSLAVVRTVAEGGAWTLIAGSLVVVLSCPPSARARRPGRCTGSAVGSASRAAAHKARRGQPIRSRPPPAAQVPYYALLQAIRRLRIPTTRVAAARLQFSRPRRATARPPARESIPAGHAANASGACSALREPTIGSAPRQPNIGALSEAIEDLLTDEEESIDSLTEMATELLEKNDITAARCAVVLMIQATERTKRLCELRRQLEIEATGRHLHSLQVASAPPRPPIAPSPNATPRRSCSS